MRFEQLPPPYDQYSVTDTGHVMDIDSGQYVVEHIDHKTNRSYVVLEGSHKKSRKFILCQLVCDMFVKNNHNLGYIYFKDGNTLNNHYKNLGYAINPHESKSRIERPFRKKVESKRHELIVKINNAVEKGLWDTAKKLGIELWELEGANWNERNKQI